MRQETVQAVDGQSITTESGEKICIGNHAFDVGESVWVDGRYAFGNDRKATAPVAHEIDEGTSEKVFVYFFSDDDGNTTCRIYDSDKMDYLEVQVKFPDEIYLNTYSLFAYSGTKFAWLTDDGDDAVLHILTADGWTKTNFKLADYDIRDMYIDENDNVIIRIFYGAFATREYDATAKAYVDSSTDGYFKYYKNGVLESTTSLSGTPLVSYLTEMLANTDTYANSADLNIKGQYLSGTDYDISYEPGVSKYNFRILDFDKAVSLANYYSTDAAGTEFAKRKPQAKSSLNSINGVTLLTWNDECFNVSLNASSSTFVGANHSGDAVVDDKYWYGFPLYHHDGVVYKVNAFAIAAVATYTDTRKYIVKNGGVYENYFTGLSIDKGDDWAGEAPPSTWVIPTNCKWIVCENNAAQWHFVELFGYGAESSNSNDISYSQPLDNGYTMTNGYTLSDGNGWTFTVKSAEVMPCFTDLKNGKVIVDGTLINKKDNSTKTLFSWESNTRMPVLENSSKRSLAALFTQSKLITE